MFTHYITLYVGRQEQASGVPVHEAVCELFHRRSLAGASVLLGVDGTVRGRRERAKFFGRNARVPMMIIAIGSGASIAGVLPEHPRVVRDRRRRHERTWPCDV